ncbi:fibropellin-3-like [Actinia tenebrosa]|uniref:Fibropellin-3-like n=1 Tax=Actinia tenebrosa TaxID=6105 RepID=A0A6P8IVN5_ACTTE|nr:fibropellin-3-like [Actinia tenebrosa]
MLSLRASLVPIKTILKLLMLLQLVQYGVSQKVDYVEFLQDAYHSLDVTILSKIRVKSSMQCLKNCRKNSNCLSYNLGAKKDQLGTLWCELLPNDKHKNLEKLVRNNSYHHYSKPSLCVNAIEYPNIKEDYIYVCNCKPGYTGLKCEININECESSPCQNDGFCKDEINRYRCDCKPGYDGKNCETDINECASNPCQNGSCINLINRYECVCTEGFTGVNCETDIDECQSSPCQYGSSCINLVNNYTCICVNGTTGPNCEINIDDCGSSPCLNNATCIDLVNNYACSCQSGFEGTNCETVSPCPSNLQYSAGGVCMYQGNGQWQDGYAECNSMSLNLPSIHSKEMNDKIRNSVNSWLWIGLRYVNDISEFAWSDGTALDYRNWKDLPSIKYEDGYCVYMKPEDSGYWFTNPCNYGNKYICV